MDDRYLLRDRLGVGGMSEVWRAHDQVLGRDVAVKVLAAGGIADQARPARIRLEARAAAGLRHPNIVEVYDYGEAADGTGRARPYVVMELVEGTALDDLLASRSLPWPVATRICAQVAAALAAAHARGVVHRDVKPGNVMVTETGVKLVDFGISAAAGAVDEADGEVLGTPAYLAPERLDGGPVRVATDVYALGLLLYRSLAGRMPWTASTVTQMVGNHLYAEPAPLPDIAGLPSPVAELCRRCLAKRPEGRPSAAEAARILGAAAGLPGSEPIDGPGAAAHGAAGTRATRAMAATRPARSRRPAMLVAAAVAVPALTASLASWQSPRVPTVRAGIGVASVAPSTSTPGTTRPTTAAAPPPTVDDPTVVRGTPVAGPGPAGKPADPAKADKTKADKAKADKAKADKKAKPSKSKSEPKEK